MDEALMVAGSLPLLDELFDYLTEYRGILKGWRCIYVQHLLESNISCLRFLERMGLDRADVAIFGKGYSTSDTVVAFLRDHGWRVWEPEFYHYDRAFDLNIIDAISEWTREHNHDDRPLLIVDEGGLASRSLDLHENQGKRVAIAELTSRGAQYYSLVSQFFPVVDVARSAIKKNIESNYIASSMIDHMIMAVPQLFNPSECVSLGLIGVGSIGSALVSQMGALDIFIKTYDQEYLNERAGFLDIVKSCEVVLSSTGSGADWVVPLQAPVGVRTLINCGSSDVEFSPWRLRRFALEHGGSFEIESPMAPWRARVHVGFERNQFTLLRGGFPINFDNSDDPIPSRVIQLTRSILMAGAIQAASTRSSGVVPLSEHTQRWILDRYHALALGGDEGY